MSLDFWFVTEWYTLLQKVQDQESIALTPSNMAGYFLVTNAICLLSFFVILAKDCFLLYGFDEQFELLLHHLAVLSIILSDIKNENIIGMLSIEPQTAAWVPSLFLFVFLLEWKQCQKLYLGKCFARISPLISNIQGEDYCAFTIKDRVMKRGLRLEDSVEPAVALFAAWAWAWTGTFVSNLLGDGVVPEKSN